MRHAVLGGFVLQDGVTFGPFGDGFFKMSGTIECVGPIIIEVEKLLAVVDPKIPTVQTCAYSYNAALRGVGNIVRYDSPHPTHHCYHHAHRYAILTGDRDGTVEIIEDDGWPTIGDLIGELETWYYGNTAAVQKLIQQQP